MSSSSNTFHFPDTGAHVPEDKDQKLVHTPYGKGLVIRTRKHIDGIQEVELLDWKTTNTQNNNSTQKTGPNRPATLFTSNQLDSIPPNVGDDVVTCYGRGTVLEIRHENKNNDSQAVVLLSSWRLAGRSRVKCYLSLSSLAVVRPKKLYEMTVYERVEYGQTLKQDATQWFQQKEYEKALHVYTQAVDAVRYVQHKKDSYNEVRGDLLVLMITCSNNAGTCCTKLQQWDDALKFAKSSLVLIEALEEKKGKKIHMFLNQEGYSDMKLFGEWKVKSYLISARSYYEKGENVEAMDRLKKAQDVIRTMTTDNSDSNTTTDPTSMKQLLANGKEVKKLYASCKDQKKAQREKEKQRAQAMFANPVQEPKKDNGKDVVEQVVVESSSSSSSHKKNKAAQQPSKTSSTKEKTKKVVSFAEDITHASSKDDDIEWYEDMEVLTGLMIFAGTVVATAAGLTYWLSRRS